MGLGTHIRGWGERAQERARRNAMVATNELLTRRREREDVEDFLARAHARHQAAAGHAAARGRPVALGRPVPPAAPPAAPPVAPPAARSATR